MDAETKWTCNTSCTCSYKYLQVIQCHGTLEASSNFLVNSDTKIDMKPFFTTWALDHFSSRKLMHRHLAWAEYNNGLRWFDSVFVTSTSIQKSIPKWYHGDFTGTGWSSGVVDVIFLFILWQASQRDICNHLSMFCVILDYTPDFGCCRPKFIFHGK